MAERKGKTVGGYNRPAQGTSKYATSCGSKTEKRKNEKEVNVINLNGIKGCSKKKVTEKEFRTAGIKISLGISYTIPPSCHILQPDLLFLMRINTDIIPTPCKKTYEKYKHSQPQPHSNNSLSMRPKY